MIIDGYEIPDNLKKDQIILSFREYYQKHNKITNAQKALLTARLGIKLAFWNFDFVPEVEEEKLEFNFYVSKVISGRTTKLQSFNQYVLILTSIVEGNIDWKLINKVQEQDSYTPYRY